MKNVFRFSFSLAMIMMALIGQTVQGQVVFSEDFDNVGGPIGGGPGTYSFPTGWLLRNVDNKTPNSAVSYVNEAWERREDFKFNTGDSCAFSTSWYTPVGAANDFMWTPAIPSLPANCVLSWNAVAYDPDYPDGYEVRIMTVAPTGGTGAIGNQLTNSTLLFSTPAADTAWTNHIVSLAAYAGQTVYIGFRNNANDQFLLLIDDIIVEVPNNYDASVVSNTPLSEYTMIPESQTTALPLEATIQNLGAMSVTNVRLKVNVYNSSMTLVHTNTSTALTTLASLATHAFNCGTFTPTTADFYYVDYLPLINEADADMTNDSLFDGILITDTTYARDDGTVTGSLGIGAGNGGFLGNQFTIVNATQIKSVSYYVTGGYLNQQTTAVIWDMVGGVPNAIIASTDTIFYPVETDSLYTLPISGGPFSLAPGDYLVSVVEFDSTVMLGRANAIYTPGTAWVDWPTNPMGSWANAEDFSFFITFVIRPNFFDCPVISATLTPGNASCSTCPDGTINTTPNGGVAPYTYDWSNSSTSQNLTGLLPGVYDVTITDANGCIFTGSVTVSFNTGIEEYSSDFRIVPNPSNGVFDLVFTTDPGENAKVEVYSSIGEKIFETGIDNSGLLNKRIDLGNIASGYYILKLTTGDKLSMKRIVVQ